MSMRSMHGVVWVPLAAVLAVGLSTPARAGVGFGEPSPEKCEQIIARATGGYFAAHTAVVRKCEKRRVVGLVAPDVSCTDDDPMASELELLAAGLKRVIGKACGGDDRTCGTPDDFGLTEIGWGDVTACPDIDGSGCTMAIDDCGDIANCVQCVGESASEQTRAVVTDEFEESEFGTDSDANECQVALLRGSTKFMQIATKVLGRCWVKRLQGKHDGDCPEDDKEAADLIARAEEKKVQYICKECGGDDEKCGGGDDVDPAAIGFAADCPDLHVPSGGSCGGAILGIEDVVDCVDCVAAFKAECVARLGAPGAADYPPECNPNGSTTTTPGSSTTTTTTTNGDCGNGVLDPGEECDPAASPDGGFEGSPGGAFCPDGLTCTSACTCVDGATSTTITKPSTTTSTTKPKPGNGKKCGNGKVDKWEQCDPSAPSGDAKCGGDSECSSHTCRCVDDDDHKGDDKGHGDDDDDDKRGHDEDDRWKGDHKD